jgi:uncharacterized protein
MGCLSEMSKVFLDTSYALALSFPSDAFHTKANQLALWLDRNSISIVTTRAILMEIGNALSKRRYRRQAIALLDSMEAQDGVEVFSLTDELYFNALTLFRNRLDKEWGLVDCVSCIVMQAQGISEVLTADSHFQQMGFRALLCESEP